MRKRFDFHDSAENQFQKTFDTYHGSYKRTWNARHKKWTGSATITRRRCGKNLNHYFNSFQVNSPTFIRKVRSWNILNGAFPDTIRNIAFTYLFFFSLPLLYRTDQVSFLFYNLCQRCFLKSFQLVTKLDDSKRAPLILNVQKVYLWLLQRLFSRRPISNRNFFSAFACNQTFESWIDSKGKAFWLIRLNQSEKKKDRSSYYQNTFYPSYKWRHSFHFLLFFFFFKFPRVVK